jgi:hypothetical protein
VAARVGVADEDADGEQVLTFWLAGRRQGPLPGARGTSSAPGLDVLAEFAPSSVS